MYLEDMTIKQENPEPLNLRRTFNLDQLPASFPNKAGITESGERCDSRINDASSVLTRMIWDVSGFRWIKARSAGSILQKHEYCCSQDSAHEKPSRSRQIRNTPRMERFPCQSKLTFCVGIHDRSLCLAMRHNHHATYTKRYKVPRATRRPAQRNENFDFREPDQPGEQSAVQQIEGSNNLVEFNENDGNVYPLNQELYLGDAFHLGDVENFEVHGEDAVSEDEKKTNETMQTFERVMEIYQEQRGIGNTRFVKSFMSVLREEFSYERMADLVNDIDCITNQETMSTMPARYRHPSSIYYQKL